MLSTPKLVVVVGTPGSGKDLLIRAVNDLGSQHAQVVPKHTSRKRRPEDGTEMICIDDEAHDFKACDLVYKNFDDMYGVECSPIWRGLKTGVFQVVVVSNVEAINKLKEKFGGLMILVYVHSEMGADEYLRREAASDDYVRRRVEQYEAAFGSYLSNYLAFDHVLIYSGVQEDLFDQIFRLFRAYEHAEVH